jgi:hypothetical protein
MTKRHKESRGRNGVEVGYGKPPVQHRFKPGQSGNPRGRPKVYLDISEIAANELARRRKFVSAGKEGSLRTEVLMMRRLANDALQGKIASGKQLIETARPHLLKKRHKNREYALITESMSPVEAARIYMEMLVQPNYEDEEPTMSQRKKPR